MSTNLPYRFFKSIKWYNNWCTITIGLQPHNTNSKSIIKNLEKYMVINIGSYPSSNQPLF
jgi:hypothetical protein